MKSRQALQDNIVTAFKEAPEICNILIFGSEVAGKIHERSDIDLIVATNDLAKTSTTYRGILEKAAGKIRGIWRIVNEPEERVESMMFEYAGMMDAYWKVDLTLVSDINRKDAFRPLKSLWRADGGDEPSQTRLPVLPALHPLEDSVSYVLFSAPRFLKSYYTNDPAVYTRWYRTIENLEMLLFEKLHHWTVTIEGKHIHAGQRSWLKSHIPENEKERFYAVFPANGYLDVYKSGMEALLWYIEMAKEKATRLTVPLNNEWLGFMEDFIQWEKKNLDIK